MEKPNQDGNQGRNVFGSRETVEKVDGKLRKAKDSTREKKRKALLLLPIST